MLKEPNGLSLPVNPEPKWHRDDPQTDPVNLDDDLRRDVSLLAQLDDGASERWNVGSGERLSDRTERVGDPA